MRSITLFEAPARLDHIGEIVAQIERELKHAEYTVALSHDNYLTSVGGIQAYMLDEEDALDRHKVSYIQIYPKQHLSGLVDSPERLYLSVNVDSVAVGDFLAADAVKIFRALAKRANGTCVSIQIHQLLGWHLDVVSTLIETLKPQSRFFWVHDYFSICPQYNLLLNGKRFCNAPSLQSNACTICRFRTAREHALPQIKQLLQRHEFTFAIPSRSARDVWCNEFPGARPSAIVVPHVSLIEREGPSEARCARTLSPNYRPRLAFIGHPCAQKGWTAWRRFVEQEDVSKSYDLYHFGSPGGRFTERFAEVSVTRDNRYAMIDALRKHKIDMVFLWSIWPETFCYVLYEATAAGCFVIAHADSGNVADYVNEHGNGLVLESEDQLRAFLGDRQKVRFRLAVFQRQHPHRYDVVRELTVPNMVAATNGQEELSTEGILSDAMLHFDHQQLPSQGPRAWRERETA